MAALPPAMGRGGPGWPYRLYHLTQLVWSAGVEGGGDGDAETQGCGRGRGGGANFIMSLPLTFSFVLGLQL